MLSLLYVKLVSPITAWEKLQQNLLGEDFQQIYNDHFPIEVRQLLSPWFETKAWYVDIILCTLNEIILNLIKTILFDYTIFTY